MAWDKDMSVPVADAVGTADLLSFWEGEVNIDRRNCVDVMMLMWELRNRRKGARVIGFFALRPAQLIAFLLKLINLGCRSCCSHEAHMASGDWVSYILVAVVGLVVSSSVVWTCSFRAGW